MSECDPSSDRDPAPAKRIPARPLAPTGDPRWQRMLTDDGSYTLRSPETGVTFHSGCGAVAETMQVYLENSGVASRIRSGQAPVRVLEFGFGTGLGFLLTADLQLAQAQTSDQQDPGRPAEHTRLHYTAIEQDLLDADVLESLDYGRHLSRPDLAAALVSWRRAGVSETRDFQFGPEIRLTLLGCNHRLALQTIRAQRSMFEAIYFDPFDPKHNQDAWDRSTVSGFASHLAPGGCLVTYCVNRRVRDTFRDAGLDVRRVPGPEGGKREVMIARGREDDGGVS